MHSPLECRGGFVHGLPGPECPAEAAGSGKDGELDEVQVVHQQRVRTPRFHPQRSPELSRTPAAPPEALDLPTADIVTDNLGVTPIGQEDGVPLVVEDSVEDPVEWRFGPGGAAAEDGEGVEVVRGGLVGGEGVGEEEEEGEGGVVGRGLGGWRGGVGMGAPGGGGSGFGGGVAVRGMLNIRAYRGRVTGAPLRNVPPGHEQVKSGDLESGL